MRLTLILLGSARSSDTAREDESRNERTGPKVAESSATIRESLACGLSDRAITRWILYVETPEISNMNTQGKARVN